MGAPRRNFFTSALIEIFNPENPVYPFETTYEWLERRKRMNRRNYKKTLAQLQAGGVLEIVKINNEKFIRLTAKGQLKILLTKARQQVPGPWDGKWRVLIFDIPETSHAERDRFRMMLRGHGFKKLQASVFISPYPLAREAIRYLEQSGLMSFIRILKVEEMDNDQDLKDYFHL